MLSFCTSHQVSICIILRKLPVRSFLYLLPPLLLRKLRTFSHRVFVCDQVSERLHQLCATDRLPTTDDRQNAILTLRCACFRFCSRTLHHRYCVYQGHEAIKWCLDVSSCRMLGAIESAIRSKSMLSCLIILRMQLRSLALLMCK